MGMSSIDDEVRPVSDKLVRVKLADLHYQYIPVVTPEELWNHDMALPTSPHVEMLKLVARTAHPNVRATRYWKERVRRREIGMAQWTDEHIEEHIRRRILTFESMRKRGFKPALYKDRPIRVLAEPFWKTRFGGTPEWVQGLEIWDGGGRCAAAYVLGWETIKVQMVRDRKPGSGDRGAFEQKLAAVEGVWSCGK